MGCKLCYDNKKRKDNKIIVVNQPNKYQIQNINSLTIKANNNNTKIETLSHINTKNDDNNNNNENDKNEINCGKTKVEGAHNQCLVEIKQEDKKLDKKNIKNNTKKIKIKYC